MRQIIAIVLVVTLASSTFAQGPVAGGAAAPRTSAVRNSFQDLTSHLDPGGNLYLYVSTEELLKGLSAQVNQWKELLGAMPDMTPEDRQNMDRVFNVVGRLIKNSGIEDVSGFGLSSIALEKDLYRVSSMLHHYRGNDSGYLWSLLGKKPHRLDGLDLMPSSAALAGYSDVDLPLVWKVLNDEIGKSGIPGAAEMMQSLPEMVEGMTGQELTKILGSLGGEYGFVVTLDETRRMVLPFPSDPPIQIPEPGGMLIIKTTNDTIFRLIDEFVGSDPQVLRTDRAGFKMRTMTPPAGAETTFRPSFAQSGDYLLLASSSALIEEAVAVKAGSRPGLKTTAEFKRLSQGAPDLGNSFSYLSPKIGQTITRIQSEIIKSSGADPAQQQLLSSFLGASAAGGSYGVVSNTDEGLISVGNTTQHPANLLLVPLMAVPLILASVAIPSLGRSRQSANEAAAIANLRTINTAEVVYYLSSNKYGDIPALIAEGLLDARFLGEINGYRFEVDTSVRGDYLAKATPVIPNPGRWGFYSMMDGVVRYSLDPALSPPGEGGSPVGGAPRRGVVRNDGNDVPAVAVADTR